MNRLAYFLSSLWALLLLTTMFTTVQAQFPIGPEFLPSYVDKHASKLIVPAGETIAMSGDHDIDAIEIRGTLNVPGQLTLRFLTITVAPGGRFQVGTAQQPNLARVELIKKDVPIDTTFDPYQWGHGIVNFGEWVVHGEPLERTWCAMDPVEAGATELALHIIPTGWKVGDQLLIPDTKQLEWATLRAVPRTEGLRQPIRTESPVFIKSISGNKLTLSKALDFEHLDGKWPNGRRAFFPVVANTSRNIVIRSENPQGSRGHTVTTKTGRQDTRYLAYVDLGRTTGDVLNNTVRNADGTYTIGINQVGKYGEHRHHSHPDHGTVDPTHVHGDHSVGCVYFNTGNAKWANSTHGTHDVHHKDSIAHGFTGAGFVNEDGDETRITYEDCWVSGCGGFQQNAVPGSPDARVPLSAKFAMIARRPGGEGAGFWLHGSDSLTMTGCISINNIVGVDIFHREQVLRQVPVEIGSTVKRNSIQLPKLVANNLCISNAQSGWELWNTAQIDGVLYRVDNLGSFHSGLRAVMFGAGEPADMHFDGLRAMNSNFLGHGIHASSVYSTRVRVTDSWVEGFNIGAGDSRNSTIYDGLVLLNNTNVSMGKVRPGGLLLRILCLPRPNSQCLAAQFEPVPVPEEMVNYPQEPEPQGFTPPDVEPVNLPPVVSAITVTPAVVYEGDTATYTATASDPENQPLSWTWWYASSNGGEEIEFLSGTGPVQPAIITYGPGGITYTWRLQVSDGVHVSSKSLVVDIHEKPDEPPPEEPTDLVEVKAAIDEIRKRLDAIELKLQNAGKALQP